MTRRLFVIALIFLTSGYSIASDAPALLRSTPEKQGIASSAILSFVQTVDQTTFSSTLNLKFAGQRLVFSSKHNVNFGPTAMPELVEQAAGR